MAKTLNYGTRKKKKVTNYAPQDEIIERNKKLAEKEIANKNIANSYAQPQINAVKNYAPTAQVEAQREEIRQQGVHGVSDAYTSRYNRTTARDGNDALAKSYLQTPQSGMTDAQSRVLKLKNAGITNQAQTIEGIQGQAMSRSTQLANEKYGSSNRADFMADYLVNKYGADSEIGKQINRFGVADGSTGRNMQDTRSLRSGEFQDEAEKVWNQTSQERQAYTSEQNANFANEGKLRASQLGSDGGSVLGGVEREDYETRYNKYKIDFDNQDLEHNIQYNEQIEDLDRELDEAYKDKKKVMIDNLGPMKSLLREKMVANIERSIDRDKEKDRTKAIASLDRSMLQVERNYNKQEKLRVTDILAKEDKTDLKAMEEAQKAYEDEHSYKTRKAKEKENWIMKEQARTPERSLEAIESQWTHEQRHDGQGNIQEKIGKEYQSIIDDIGDSPLTNYDFGRLVESADGDMTQVRKLLKNRKGEAVADDVYEDYLVSKGWDEESINEDKFSNTVTDLIDGTEQGFGSLQRVVKQAEDLGLSDEWISSALSSIYESPDSSGSVKIFAKDMVDEYKAKEKNGLASTSLMNALGSDPSLYEDLSATQKIKALNSGFVAENESGGSFFGAVKESPLSYGIPTQLMNSEAEEERIRNMIKKGVNDGIPASVIRDTIMGYQINTKENEHIGSVLKNKLFGLEDLDKEDFANLSNQINSGNKKDAVKTIERKLLSNANPEYLQNASYARGVIKQVDEIITLLEDPKISGAMGMWDKGHEEAQKKFSLTSEETRKFQKLQTKMQFLMQNYRVENLGTAATANEEVNIGGIMATMSDQPEIAGIKLQEFQRGIMTEYNSIRNTSGLDELTPRQAIDDKELVKFYESKETIVDPLDAVFYQEEKWEQKNHGGKSYVEVDGDKIYLEEGERLSDYGVVESIQSSSQGGDILEQIGQAESGGNYNAIFGNANQSNVDFGEMTIDEVLTYQQNYINQGNKGSAIGKYQIIPKTMKDLKRTMFLDGNEKFTPEMQDQMANVLLDRRGKTKFENGEITEAEYRNNIAKEWASIRNSSGKGHYDNDGLNNAYADISFGNSSGRYDAKSVWNGTITGINGSKYNKDGLDYVISGPNRGYNAPVPAPIEGEVIKVVSGFKGNPKTYSEGDYSQNNGWGNQVVIKTPDGKTVQVSHLADTGDLKEGTKIAHGDIIGKQGNTGNTYSNSGGNGTHLDIVMLDENGEHIAPKEIAKILKLT